MKTTKSKTNMTKKVKGDGMPTRALTAYNLFFAKERQKLMEKQKKDGAAPVAETIKSTLDLGTWLAL